MPPRRAVGRRPSSRNANLSEPPAKVSGNATSDPEVTKHAVQETSNASNPNAIIQNEMPPPSSLPTSASSRPQNQRLDSLSRSSSGSAFSPATAAAPGAKSILKFKPKNVRRSKEEREAAELAEAIRLEQRRAAAGKPESANNRGNWPGRGSFQGRGRGSRGARGGKDLVSTASGPFASGSVTFSGKKRLSVPGLGRSTASTTDSSSTRKTTSSVKTEPRATGGEVQMGEGSRMKVETHDTVYISSDDEAEQMAEGPRIDIEHINLISDEEDEDPITTKGKSRDKPLKGSAGGLKPIRVERKPHADRNVAVNTEASAGASANRRQREEGTDEYDDSSFLSRLGSESVKPKGKVRTRDVEFVKDERRWRGVWQTNDEGEDVMVKEEPKDAEEITVMEIDPVTQGMAVDTSADNASVQEPSASSAEVEDKEETKPPTRRQRKAGLRDDKPVLQTEEDRQEWARHQHDLQLLVDELGLMPTAATSKPKTTNLDPEGDTNMDEQTASIAEVKDNRLFLFQFPPIIPGLVDRMLKEEPSDGDQDSAKAESVPSSSTTHKAGTGTLARGSKSASNIKHNQETALKPVPFTSKMTYLPPGLAGKLKIHASGRTTISWGGASLELSRAGDSEFLQEIILADVSRKAPNDDAESSVFGGDDDEGNPQRKNALGLGSVMGKYIVTPDWKELFS